MSDPQEESMILENTKRRKHCDNQNEDRLSDLPDGVLLHILSFLNTKYIVQTCVLSKRWRHLWKRIPTLILHCSQFSTKKRFATFVSKILTLRDTETALNALDLVRGGNIEPQLLKMILNYVCSHNTNLRELRINVRGDSGLIMSSISSCHALTSLELSIYPRGSSFISTLFPKSLNLPSLTSLNISNFAFCGGESGCVEPFFAFTKLSSLVIRGCEVKDAQILSISSETLVDLTIKGPLEKINSAIQDNSVNFAEIKLSTPNLYTFNYKGDLIQKICQRGLSSVKQVNIDDSRQYNATVVHSFVLLCWLLDFANVESLTVTSTTLQILSLFPPNLLEVKLPSLHNLKSLEVKLIPLGDGYLSQTIKDTMLKKAAAKSRKEVAKLRKAFKARLEPPAIPDGIVDFLRQNSPSAEINISTGFTGHFNLKQVEESIKGAKIVEYHSRYSAPGSSSTGPASAAAPASVAVSASAASPNLHLCRSDEDDKLSNEDDKVEKHQSIKGAKIVEYHSRYSPPGSSSTGPASAAAPASVAVSASAASPNLHLCRSDEDDKSSNEDDKVEKHQPNFNPPLLDNGQ